MGIITEFLDWRIEKRVFEKKIRSGSALAVNQCLQQVDWRGEVENWINAGRQ